MEESNNGCDGLVQGLTTDHRMDDIWGLAIHEKSCSVMTVALVDGCFGPQSEMVLPHAQYIPKSPRYELIAVADLAVLGPNSHPPLAVAR